MCNPFGGSGKQIRNADGSATKAIDVPVTPAAAPVVAAPVVAAPAPVIAAPAPVVDTAQEAAGEAAKREARRRGRASTILTGGLGDANFGASVNPTALQATYLG